MMVACSRPQISRIRANVLVPPLIGDFAPKWDVYSGVMFTRVKGGLASGFLLHNNLAPRWGFVSSFERVSRMAPDRFVYDANHPRLLAGHLQRRSWGIINARHNPSDRHPP
ncbi:hypothetical protein [Bradyrhizobium sp. STM 3562]|uniref:hypothetical protein n=1 Tax=Bradyrhizobium sp. STM 3562 TaxID=578924 RepID=UPI00388D0CF3